MVERTSRLSFYGGIAEELLMRLIFMTLFVWLLAKVFARSKMNRDSDPSPVIYWAAILISSVIFAIGHFPATQAVWDLTPWVITRGLVLTLYAAIPFGFLFWQWGLEFAMLAIFLPTCPACGRRRIISAAGNGGKDPD